MNVAQAMQNGWATVGTSPAQLTDNAFQGYQGIILRAPGSQDDNPNTDVIYVSTNPALTANDGPAGGFAIVPGMAIGIPLDKVSKLYAVSTATGQKLSWAIL